MSRHTPGPWVCHSGMVWKADGSENGYPIARMDRDTLSTVPTERDANAHLIASSPSIYVELERVAKELAEWLRFDRLVKPAERWHGRRDAEMAESLASIRAVLTKEESNGQ